MKNQILTSVWLAFRDWRHESLISLCAVLALASMLAPLLVLQGLKNGVTQEMRARLLRDPATLIIVPKSDAGKYTPEFIKEIASMPGARYAIGRTRETAADITLRHGEMLVPLSLEPSGPGEPVLANAGIAAPKDGKTPELVLSATAAGALKAKPGDIISASLGRRAPDGRLESMPMDFRVSGILPITAADRRMAFAPHTLLEDMEKYRDYIAVDARGMAGRPGGQEQTYASFRLYADSLDNVAELAAELGKKNIETTTRAREIASIKALESAINQVILIISLAVGTGFAAFMLSSSEGAIRRKRKMLGLLRLFGFRRLPLVFYPLAQTLLTAFFGFSVSLAAYFAVAWGIARAFAERGGLSCQLTAADAGTAIGAVLLVSALASARAAWQAANLEPSMVIREV